MQTRCHHLSSPFTREAEFRRTLLRTAFPYNQKVILLIISLLKREASSLMLKGVQDKVVGILLLK